MPQQQSPQQAQTVALPKRLPLVLEPENRLGDASYDAKLVNAYMETKKNSKTNELEVWIYERPGLSRHSQPSGGAATGRGMFLWRGNVYSIFGNTLYKDGVAVVGTVDTTNGGYIFDSCLGATPKLVLGNGVKGYTYDSTGGLVAITDADFPASFVKGWAYLDGTEYVMTSAAAIQGSAINDPTSWDPANTLTAQIEPDRGVRLAKQLVYVVAAKEWTTEVFYDAANTSGSPLGRVEGAKINWGCVNADSMIDMDGELLWLAKTRYGSPEVLHLSSLKPEVVSTKAVERLLSTADFSTETVYAWALKLDGHRFYIVTCKTANFTLAYDLDEKMWSQWSDVNGNYLPIVASCTDTQLRNLVQHESNGRIYIISASYALDDTDLITVDIVTPNNDLGTRRGKQMNRLEVIADQVAGSELQIRFNDFDYNPKKWTNFQTLDMSRRLPFLTNLGTFKRRVTHLRHKKPVRMPRIQALEMQVDLCTL